MAPGRGRAGKVRSCRNNYRSRCACLSRLSVAERSENALVVSQPPAGPMTVPAIGPKKLRELLESIPIDSCQNYQARKVQGDDLIRQSTLYT